MMTEAGEIVRLENVWVHFNGAPVLEDISLTIESAEFLGIIGPNGSGKSTLIKVILGLIEPDRGTVSVLGKAPTDRNTGVGYVPQYALFDHEFPASVREVVLMARYRRGWLPKRYTAEDKNISKNALQATGMTEYGDRQIGQLSGGQQQRVLIARALATNPKLLLLDEPTASVDPDTQSEFYQLLQRLRKDMAIVMVSHDIEVVRMYADKIVCLNKRLLYHGSSEVTPEVLETTYKCPIGKVVHGDIPNLRKHKK
jgi:zinc transport system ATP-binding protein